MTNPDKAGNVIDLTKPNKKDNELIDEAVRKFQDAGVRVGLRMVYKLISCGATLDQVKKMCEDWLS